MNKKYNELREKYNTFIYNSYNIKEENENIIIEYDFQIVGLETFNPKLVIPISSIEKTLKKAQFDTKIDLESSIVKNLVFNIGMVEVISYLKLTCSKNLIINCGYLNEEQQNWFKKLYLNGLGEFFYVNDIQVNESDFLTIKSNESYKDIKLNGKRGLKGQLIPVGGGKDSNVTMEVLKPLKEENTAFIINKREATLESVKAGGYLDNVIIIDRILDKKMLELNKQGFLNGHTPFSAMLAFVSTLIAYLSGKKYVVLSNEASASESNVVGTNINHQYSKSIEFENDFRDYSKKYLKTQVEYFSLLRPLTEVQISKMFATYTGYHKIFKSCNVGSKQDIWCCSCSKCLFVYIMLSNFLSTKELVNIFGEDLLDKKELQDTFIKLIGKGENKPFDCVGTYDEINYCIASTIIKRLNKNKKLPFLLEYYYTRIYMLDRRKLQKVVDENYNRLIKGYLENNLPEKFDKLLKEVLEEVNARNFR